MVINFTKKFQFNTRIALQNTLLEEVEDCRLLGLTLTNQLSWHQNSENIVKKANTRMIILQKLYNFNLPTEEMIFPLNTKTVNTRPHEKYFVTKARTERLAKSAVPYLQRLLNNQ
jgi:hypothetical protein